MDTTVAKSAKRKIAPVRPKAAKAAPAKKAKKTVAAKRPKPAVVASKSKQKPIPAKKTAARKPTVAVAAKRDVKSLAGKPAPSAKPVAAKTAKPAVSSKRPAPPPAPARKAKPAPPPPPPPPQLDKAAKKASLERQRILQAQEKANQGALKVFEQALKSFHRQEYDVACEALKRIFKEFGNEVEVASRARDYITVCEQRMEKPKNGPKSSEANYSQGVFELNAGRYQKAADLLEKAARMEPNSAYIIYSLAAAQAQLNDTDSAMESLRRAIQLLESLRNRARRDSDFSNLMGHEEFRELVGMEEAPLVL
jgi:tetratricopeptide (TPR) repeat protein